MNICDLINMSQAYAAHMLAAWFIFIGMMFILYNELFAKDSF